VTGQTAIWSRFLPDPGRRPRAHVVARGRHRRRLHRRLLDRDRTHPQIEQLEERYVNGEEVDDSIAREEIRTRALNMTPSRLTYYAMTVLSAVVATAGLLLDSPAIVVGSMVIAPQVSAALTGTVGVVLDDREMVRAGSRRWRSDSSSRSSARLRVRLAGALQRSRPPRRSTSPPSLRCKTESHRVYSPSSSASVQGQRVRSASRRRSPFHWSA